MRNERKGGLAAVGRDSTIGDIHVALVLLQGALPTQGFPPIPLFV